MRRLLALFVLLALASPCWAQTLGNVTHCTLNDATGNCSLPLPTGVVNGNVLLACVHYSSAAAPTDNTGFTGTASASAIICGWKTANNETGPYNYNFADAAYAVGSLGVWSGTAGVDVSAINSASISSSTWAEPNLTTTVANDVFVEFAGVGSGGGYTISSFSSPFSIDNNYNSGFGASLAIGHRTTTTAGAYTGTTVTYSGSTSLTVTGLSIALKPYVCSTLTGQVIQPNGAGSGGVCLPPPNSTAVITNCYVVHSGDLCSTQVNDQSANCNPGTAPSGGGSNVCDVACYNSGSGCTWVDD